MDIDEEADSRKGKLYVPNWFSVEVKTGVSVCMLHVRVVAVDDSCHLVILQMLTIRLEETDCFSAWVMGNDSRLETAVPELKCECTVYAETLQCHVMSYRHGIGVIVQ